MKTKTPLSVDKRAWHPSPLMEQIVLVTTLNSDGTSNVAPKSSISMMVFEPPILALGCNLTHWTARNAIRTRQFIVNVPGSELADVVWQAHVHEHPRPVEAIGLTPRSAQLLAPPLIDECKAHLECTLERSLPFGEEVILLGRIVAASVDQQAAQVNDPYEYLRLIAYLENRAFGVVECAHHIQPPSPGPR